MMEIPQIKDQDIEILKYTHAVLARFVRLFDKYHLSVFLLSSLLY